MPIDKQKTYWTDYPIIELGDKSGKEAPIRKCSVISYDGSLYATIMVGGVVDTIKIGYIYHERGRSGEASRLSHKEAMRYERKA